MKKILLAISFLLFASCTEYTVKVEANDVSINNEPVENGKCVTYKKAFFGWFGDSLTVKVGEKETSYEEGHYVVGEEVTEVKEACEEVDNKETTATGDGTATQEEVVAEVVAEVVVKPKTALEIAQQEKQAADDALAKAEKEKKDADDALEAARTEANVISDTETAKTILSTAQATVNSATQKLSEARAAVGIATQKLSDEQAAVNNQDIKDPRN